MSKHRRRSSPNGAFTAAGFTRRARRGLGLVVVGVVSSMIAGANSVASNEPVLTSPIAQAFPAVFREGAPSEGIAPRLAPVNAAGVFAVESGGNGSLHADLAKGFEVVADGLAFGVAPVGVAAVGAADDDALIYERPDGTEVAMRPTGDGGVEIIEVADSDLHYALDIPVGTKLVALDNGDVAVVQPGLAPIAEVGEVARQLTEAQAQVIAAGVESAGDAAEEADAFDAISESLGEIESAELPSEALVEPTDEEVAGDDDVIPLVFADAAFDPDEPIEPLVRSLEEVENGLEVGDYVTEDLQAVAEAEASLQEISAVAADLDVAEDLGVEAEASAEIDGEIDAVLSEDLVAQLEDEVAAGLDIGDAEREQLRTAAHAVAAQAEIGDQDRVLAILSAPLTRDVDGIPVATSFDVTAPDEVALRMPAALDRNVVVDPFFVPIAFFAVRVAVQRLAPTVVRAGMNLATKTLSRAGSRAAQQSAHAQARVRQAQAAVRARVEAARAEAHRRFLAARAQAAARAWQARVQAAERARQWQARMERAKNIAAQRARAAQSQAKAARDAAIRRAEEMRRAAAERAASIASRSMSVAQRTVVGAAKQGLTVGRSVAERGRNAALWARDRAAAILRASIQEITYLPYHSGGRALLVWTIEEALEKALYDDEPYVDCASLPGPLESLFDAVDVAECVNDVMRKQLAEAVSTVPISDVALADGFYPTAEELHEDMREALAQADELAGETLPSFPAPPPDAAERAATIVNTSVPKSINAGSRAFIQIMARNIGGELSLMSTQIAVEGGLPYVRAGHVPGDTSRLPLTDENADGWWEHGELASAIVEVAPPVMRSRLTTVRYGFIAEGTTFSAGNTLNLNVVGPNKTLVVFNKLTNGSLGYREDPTPARLTTKPWRSCSTRGCNVAGTERRTGGTYFPAVCWTTGDRTTNGEDASTRDDRYQYTSSNYYGVVHQSVLRYISWVWIDPSQRTGLGLPKC